MDVTEQALYKGIDQAVANGRLSDISHAVQKHVEDAGFSIVRIFVGHGIGSNLHEDPQIPNFSPGIPLDRLPLPWHFLMTTAMPNMSFIRTIRLSAWLWNFLNFRKMTSLFSDRSIR